MRLLAVDPGKRLLAWSKWAERFLGCGLVRTESDHLGFGAQDLASQLPTDVDLVVVELPRIYPYERRIQVNDLIDLAAVAGACAAVGPLEFVWPATWKGQTPKHISHERIRRALEPEERELLARELEGIPSGLRHNVLDAVGIGQWRRRRDGHG